MDRVLRVTTTGAADPAVSPDPGTPLGGGEWRPLTTARQVPLGELLTIAVLTPAQAVLVTADLLEATGADPSERIQAVLTVDGAIEVTRADEGTPGVAPRVLVDEVLRNAHRLPAHPQPHQLGLVHHLDAQVGASGDPVERATALRAALAEVAGGDAVPRIRRELAALREAFTGIAISRSTSPRRVNGDASGPAPAVRPAALRPPRGPAPHRTHRRRRRSRWLLVGLVVLALALIGGSYLVLGAPGSGLLDLGRDGGSDASSAGRPTPPRAPGDQQTGGDVARHVKAFPALAAPASGRVRGVVLQETSSCHPGAACTVKVTIDLAPAPASQTLGWRVGVAQRCARHVIWSPQTTVTAQPGWTHVFASSPVQVPQGRSLALVALTSTPTHAQSRPVPVAGTSQRC